MNQITIDINADVGEGIGNEAELMPYLSSCNIACGGHAGSPEIIKTVIQLAKKHDVKIGAHPSFPDPQNFGRKEMALPTNELVTSLKSQIKEVLTIAKSLNVYLHHVKPHGALYNLVAKNTAIAKLLVAVIKSFKEPLCLYVPPNGTSLQNKDLLKFFHDSTWNVIGLEMEGVHYQKAIQAASKIRRSINPNVKVRYAYYASDNPLETGGTLASGGLGSSGVKPTYLITQQILKQIFN